MSFQAENLRLVVTISDAGMLLCLLCYILLNIYVHMFSASVSVFKLCYSGPASHNPRTCIRTSEELHQAFQDLPHTIWNVEQELVKKNPQFEL